MRSPALKSKSPSACASKSYNATTYCFSGSASRGFGFSGGGGGAFLAAVKPGDVTPVGEYGGGAAAEVGIGGDALVKLEVDVLDGERIGAPLRDAAEDAVSPDVDRPRVLPPAALLA